MEGVGHCILKLWENDFRCRYMTEYLMRPWRLHDNFAADCLLNNFDRGCNGVQVIRIEETLKEPSTRIAGSVSYIWHAKSCRIANQRAPCRGLSSPPGSKCRKSLENVSRTPTGLQKVPEHSKNALQTLSRDSPTSTVSSFVEYNVQNSVLTPLEWLRIA